jgi:hypothetical protein
MSFTPAELERMSRAEVRISAAATRARALRDALDDELSTRDDAILEAIDSGALSERRAARAAGLSNSGLRDVIARAG